MFSQPNDSSTHPKLRALSLRMACCCLVLSALAYPAELSAREKIIRDKSDNKSTAISESSDEIDNTLDDVKQSRKTLLPNGPMSRPAAAWEDFWHLVDEKSGLSMAFAYTTLFQAATKGNYTGPRSGGSSDFDMIGRWSLINPDDHEGWINEGTIGFATEYRSQFGNATPADLGESLGSLWGITAGFNEEDFTLKELWWHQHLFDDHLAFRLGRISLDSIFDAYRFTGANHFYTNKAFSRNPTIPFPNTGLGLVFAWNPGHNLFAIVGGGSADGREAETTTAQQGIKEWFSATTLGWKPKHDLGTGLYQVTFWHSKARSGNPLPEATGYSILLQQEFANGWTPFTRYAYSSAAVTDTKRIITAGVVHEGSPRKPTDRVGVALAWGQAHNDNYRDQWTAELFYRYSITPSLRITPLAQIIVNPAKNPYDQVIGVFGLRGRFTF
ncbi:MAG: carbohydrate porin [Verrucomicrobiales bacterium]|nr:carbohydrate porin [Verrucomicrobiales bacterium]